MAALNAIAREYADEIRDGIAWVIVWKTGRSWNAEAFWLNCDDDTFELEDLERAREISEQDPSAVMVNGYYCGHFGEDITVAELAAGIRWHYENGTNLLKDSDAFPPEPMERPEWLPADMPWYGKATSAEPDPYVYDGYMSVEDYEHMHELIAADQQQENEYDEDDNPVIDEGIWEWSTPSVKHGELFILNTELAAATPDPPDLSGIPPDTAPELNESMTLELTIGPEGAAAITKTIKTAFEQAAEAARKIMDAIVAAFKKAAAAAAKVMSDFMGSLLYKANNHPKWWHLYKHAKKYRVRKKYRKRLMQQLIERLRAAPTMEVIT